MPPNLLDAAVRAVAAVLRAGYSSEKTDDLFSSGLGHITLGAAVGAPVSVEALRELLPALRGDERNSSFMLYAVTAIERVLLDAEPIRDIVRARAQVFAGDAELLAALAKCLRSPDHSLAAAAARVAGLLGVHRPVARAIAAAEPEVRMLDALVRLLLLAAPRAALRFMPRTLGGVQVGERASELNAAYNALDCVGNVLFAHNPAEQLLLWKRLELLPVAVAAQLYSERERIVCVARDLLIDSRPRDVADSTTSAQSLYTCTLLSWRRAEEELLREPPQRPSDSDLFVWMKLLAAMTTTVIMAARSEYFADGSVRELDTNGRRRGLPPQLQWSAALDTVVLRAPWLSLYRTIDSCARIDAEYCADGVARIVTAQKLGFLLQWADPARAYRSLTRAELERDLARIEQSAPRAVMAHAAFKEGMQRYALMWERVLTSFDKERKALASPKPPRMCAVCKRTKADGAESLRRCRGCGEGTGVRYCSVECARVHWKRMWHRHDCQPAQTMAMMRHAYAEWREEFGSFNTSVLKNYRKLIVYA